MEATICTGQKQSQRSSKKNRRGKGKRAERPSAEAMWLTHVPTHELPQTDLERAERHYANTNLGRPSPYWFNKELPREMVKCAKCGTTYPAIYIGSRGICDDCQQFSVARSRARFIYFEEASNTPWGMLGAKLDRKGVDERMVDLLVAYVECFLRGEWEDLPRVLSDIHRLSGEDVTGLGQRRAELLLTEIRYDLESYFMALSDVYGETPADDPSEWVQALGRMEDERSRLAIAPLLPESERALRAEIERFNATGRLRSGE